MIKKAIREPLLHFLIMGGLLFLIYKKTATKFNSEKIEVSKNDLINYMQYQANGFNRDVFEKKYAVLSPSERQVLLNRYSEELILVKEAENLNLQQNDNVIKTRLIQKVKFVLKSEISEINPSQNELKTYYDLHPLQYSSSEKYSFSHIFFSTDTRTDAKAFTLANEFLQKSKRQFISPTEALAFSDRFPYFNNYTQRNLDFIASNFEVDFTEKIQTLSVSKNTWQGPLKSNLGYHAVLLIAKDANKVKPFEEAKDLVKAHYIDSVSNVLFKDKIESIKKQYKIEFID